MSRVIKVVIALVIIAVLWKVLSSRSSSVEVDYDPIE